MDDIIRVSPDTIDPASLMTRVREDSSGAVAAFVGVVRDNSGGRPVHRLQYQAYPPMAERELARIATEARRRWALTRLARVHRTGDLAIGETSVAVVVGAPHRREALEACSFAIEEIKRSVPIWKREFGEGGSAWVIGDPTAPPHGDPTR